MPCSLWQSTVAPLPGAESGSFPCPRVWFMVPSVEVPPCADVLQQAARLVGEGGLQKMMALLTGNREEAARLAASGGH